MIRIATAGFQHESNTFSSITATLMQFEQSGILYGADIRAEYQTSQSSLAGFFALEREDPHVQIVPLVFSRLTPMGAITQEAHEDLMRRILEELQSHGPWDGILLPLHGAAVGAVCHDADGELISRVRALVGPRMPIGVALDMHANLTPCMVRGANITTVYQTNPHVDAFEQGKLCARLLVDLIRGQIRPCTALAMPPLVVNILNQGTNDQPMAQLIDRSEYHRQRPGVLSVSVIEGYPYADVAEMGMSFLALTDGQPALAQEIVDDLARTAWALRAELNQGGMTMEEALRRAMAAPEGPVVLFDVGDNVGGGSPGDSTHLLHMARVLGATSLLQTVADEQAVQHCLQAGVGAQVSLNVGGKTHPLHGAPFPVQGRVLSISDGRYEETGLTHGGFRFFDDGPSVAIRTSEGWTLVLSTRTGGTPSLQQFRHLGVEPCDHAILIAKGVHSPRPAVEPIAKELLWVGTPGVTSADLFSFTYEHRRRPMYPFEPETDFST
jgi:microcystin degradation protein MlrC